jgi:large subunit ribosomal protein L24e
MVETRTCSFCGGPIEPGTGKMFVKRDGSIFYFCSSKCQNNYRIGRVSRRVAWTAAGRKALGKG